MSATQKLFGLLIATALLGASCATGPVVALDSAAQDVSIVQTASEDEGYVHVGAVSCSYGYNARDISKNKEGCRNDMRNQAAAMDADVIVIQSRHRACTNCIGYEAKAFRKE